MTCMASNIKALDLKEFSQSDSFNDLVEVLKRAKNILKKQKDVPVVFTDNLFEDESEIALGKKVKAIENDFTEALNEQNYKVAMTIFVTFKKELADFFENVMVMADNDEVKNNRLGLLVSYFKNGRSAI